MCFSGVGEAGDGGPVVLQVPLLSSPSPLLSLGVEYLKVLSLSVEPAYASLSVEPPLLSMAALSSPSPLLISRAP
jgi:hypothetical protein